MAQHLMTFNTILFTKGGFSATNCTKIVFVSAGALPRTARGRFTRPTSRQGSAISPPPVLFLPQHTGRLDVRSGFLNVIIWQVTLATLTMPRRRGWLGSRVVSVLDSGAEGPGFKSQPWRCRPYYSLRQTVHTHRASVHQAAKLIAVLLRVARVTAGLAESNGSLPPGLWLTSPAGWLPRTAISSGTLRSVIEYGLLFIARFPVDVETWRSEPVRVGVPY